MSAQFAKALPDKWITTPAQRIAMRKIYRHARRGGCNKYHANTVVTQAFSAGYLAGLDAGLNWQNKR